jgi:hypothetical protein
MGQIIAGVIAVLALGWWARALRQRTVPVPVRIAQNRSRQRSRERR